MIPIAAPDPTRHSAVGQHIPAIRRWTEEAPRWHDVEIQRFEALLSQEHIGQVGPAGGGTGDPIAPLIQGLLDAPDTGESMRRLFTALSDSQHLVDALAEVEGATSFTSVLELARQRRGARRLREVVYDSESTEVVLKSVLTEESWVFGGRYIPVPSQERVRALREVDIPLIGSDRGIHVVVVGPANVPDLIVRTEDRYRVGPIVDRLVDRARVQLELVDEDREAIQTALRGIEARRAFGTVVVGHSRFTGPASGNLVKETVRGYNSFLQNIEVVTYEQLMDGAERMLALLDYE